MRQILKTVFPLVFFSCVLTVTGSCERSASGNDTENTQQNAQAGQNEDATTAADDSADWAKTDQDNMDTTLDYPDIEKVIINLSPDQKRAYLDDAENFKQFVQQEANNISVLAAARMNKVQEDENTRFLMQRSADNILRETYLGKLINGKLPDDFPTAEQVREYFDKNKESFFLGERVHVWQIFLKLDDSMDEKTKSAVKQKIVSIRQDIENNKIDFADAAMKYSEHGPSQANGGYMGLVKVSDLKPELAGPLLGLQEGRLSDPVTSDAGIHLLKRGTIIPRQDVSFEQVKVQIRDLLMQQASAQLRQAIYQQAAKSYPVEVDDATIEEWRQRLIK